MPLTQSSTMSFDLRVMSLNLVAVTTPRHPPLSPPPSHPYLCVNETCRALSGRSESGGYDEITGWTLCTTYNGMGKLAWRPPAAAAGLWTATLKYDTQLNLTHFTLVHIPHYLLHTHPPPPGLHISSTHLPSPFLLLRWLESHGGAASALEPQQVSQLLWSLCALGPPPEAEPLFHYLLHEAALLVTRGGYDHDTITI